MVQIIYIFSYSILFNLNNIDNRTIPFNFSKPELKIELSKELKEISGLTWLGNNQLGAIQDEAGIIYVLNATTGKITEKIKFSLPGDFEGVEMVGTCLYALSSSGKIYYFDRGNPKNIQQLNTLLNWRNDAEGLGYDKKNEQLLIVCKENGSVKDANFKGKSIFSLNVSNHYFSKKPLATIKKTDIQKFKAIEKFKPSAIAVDPLTNDVYILSSVGKLLVVLDYNYTIKVVQKLPSSIYAQPEGICFSPNGDLFISNEGEKGKSNFYRLKRK
ncbi:MAG: SdiA-regulated domain-containing protein [Cyclobacteriaceae bacterium]|nr:SdiA-regulated domain-containing protein [Cyclobacteriaceae bacterium]